MELSQITWTLRGFKSRAGYNGAWTVLWFYYRISSYSFCGNYCILNVEIVINYRVVIFSGKKIYFYNVQWMVKFFFVCLQLKNAMHGIICLFVFFQNFSSSISWHFSFQNQLWLGHLFFLPSFPRVKVWCPLSLSLSKYWTFLLWKSAICSSSNLRWSSTVFFSSETEIFISSNRACNWKSMT